MKDFLEVIDSPVTDIEDRAIRCVKNGARWAYDTPDMGENDELPPVVEEAKDWAHAAARGILYDLCDRRGIKNGFDDIDEDVRKEIVESLAAVIRAAKQMYDK